MIVDEDGAVGKGEGEENRQEEVQRGLRSGEDLESTIETDERRRV